MTKQHITKHLSILTGEEEGDIFHLKELKIGDLVFEMKENKILQWEVISKTSVRIKLKNQDSNDIINTQKTMTIKPVSNFFIDKDLGVKLMDSLIEKENEKLQDLLSQNYSNSYMNQALKKAKKRVRELSENKKLFY